MRRPTCLILLGLVILASDANASWFRCGRPVYRPYPACPSPYLRVIARPACFPVYHAPCYPPAYYPCPPGIVVRPPDNTGQNGSNQNASQVNPADLKVQLVFAFDTDDDTLLGLTGIAKTKATVKSMCDKYLDPKFRAEPEPLDIPISRSEMKPPSGVIDAIKAVPSSEKEVLFVYMCGHAGYRENEHLLFINSKDDKDYVKRSDLIAALKAKKCHAIVLITDACSVDIAPAGDPDRTPIVGGTYAGPARDELHKVCANLPKGRFLNINTSTHPEFAALTERFGSAASLALDRAMWEKHPKWPELETAWQKHTSAEYHKISDKARLDPNAKIKDMYARQADQRLDIKRD